MIHAYLFVQNIREGNGGHGANFHKMMYGINRQAGTNITVYHTFHDEVRIYQKHWWRCDGPCRNRGPFYGYVKRAVNRAPGPSEFWFSKHQHDCGGNFTKIKEPTPKKKAPKGKSKAENTKKPQSNKISNYVIGSGGSGKINRGGNTMVITKPPATKTAIEKPVFKVPQNIPNKTTGPSTSSSGNLKNVVGFKDIGAGPRPLFTSRLPVPVFAGQGKTLGGPSTLLGPKRSRLLDQFESPKKKPKIEQFDTTIFLSDDDDDVILAIDLDEINKTSDQKAQDTEIRQSQIKKEIIDSNSFGDEDTIFLIDDEYDDTLNEVPESDLNLSVEVLNDIFGEDTLTKDAANKKPCVICWKEIPLDQHADHLENCYEELLRKSNELISGIPSSYQKRNNTNSTNNKRPTSIGFGQPSTSKILPVKQENDVIIIPDVEILENEDSIPCPVCAKLIKLSFINQHLDNCLNS